MKISQNLKAFRKKLVLPTDIVQYNLQNFNTEMHVAWYHIRAIYINILEKDTKWHFFYEGDYTIIRCQRKHTKKLEKYLKEHTIEYEFRGKWVGDHSMVMKYIEYFEPMFHSFSMMALSMHEAEIMHVADRIIHPFFNHCTYMAEDLRSKFGNHTWEAYVMANMVAGRGIHAGRLVQDEMWKQNVAKAKETDKEEVGVDTAKSSEESD